LVVVLLAASGVAFFIASVSNKVVGDVPVYEQGVRRLLAGEWPWLDFVYEYPPYSLLLALLPAAAPEGWPFRWAFAAEMLALHLVLGWLVLREGRAHLPGAWALAPFGLLTASAVLLEYVYLKRFDLAPALTCVLAVLAARDGRAGRAAAWLGVGFGLKLYPVALLPLVVVPAWRTGRARECAVGLTVAAAPLAVLLLGLPWWKVFAFHSARGLQVESMGGSMLWFAHRLGLAAAEWTNVDKWVEVGGPSAGAIRLASSLGFLLAVPLSAAAATTRLVRSPRPSIALLSRAALTPLLAALVFSSVLSPQFHLWLVGLAALSMTDGRWRTAALVLAATALVPLFYPNPSYQPGLDWPGTLALVARNLVLLAAWIGLLVDDPRDR
jgi:hypothetical protein